jgi:hypothetical protein
VPDSRPSRLLARAALDVVKGEVRPLPDTQHDGLRGIRMPSTWVQPHGSASTVQQPDGGVSRKAARFTGDIPNRKIDIVVEGPGRTVTDMLEKRIASVTPRDGGSGRRAT